MTISVGPTPVSRTVKTFGTPRCMDRVRPTLSWSPSRFCTQSVLLWGINTCRMICQYSTLIESFLFLKNVPSMQPEDSSRILPSAMHGGYMLTLKGALRGGKAFGSVALTTEYQVFNPFLSWAPIEMRRPRGCPCLEFQARDASD